MASVKVRIVDALVLNNRTATPSAADIMLAIGSEKTVVLCNGMGGIRCRASTSNRAMLELIGLEALNAMHAYFGGEMIYIPRNPYAQEPRLNEVRQLREAGMTVTAIALKLGMTERHCYRLLARMRATQLVPRGHAS